MEDDFMRGKKPLVKRHVLKSEIRRVDRHESEEPEMEASDDSTIISSQRDITGFMHDYEYDMEDRTVKQIIALGCDVSVSKKVVTDTLDRIEGLGKHPDQPGRTARVEIFYFISHVMQSHSRQMLIQQASNPFKNPEHMAVIITRLMEIYLAGNPSIRFLIITYPMHHLSLMLALRDHIGVDVFKIVAIVPAAPFSQRTSSLFLGAEGDFTTGRISPTVYPFDRNSSPVANPFVTPDQPSRDDGKPDFVLYTTSPFDTVERVPMRIDLLIQEIEEYVNPPEDSSPAMVPRPAVAWGPEPTGLPHPLANVTRAGNSTPLEPIDLEAAVRYQTTKLMAKYQYQRLKRNPGAPPREPEVVTAQWEHTYKKVHKAFRKIKLSKDKPDLGGMSINPSDDDKADDECDPGNSEDETDDGSISFISITPIKDDTGLTAATDDPFKDDTEANNASTGTVQRHPVNSNEELNSGDGSSPAQGSKKGVSFSPLSMSYSFEKNPSDRSSGFWAQYAKDHL